MSSRMQNILSACALVAAFVITMLPESTSTPARASNAPVQVSQLSR